MTLTTFLSNHFVYEQWAIKFHQVNKKKFSGHLGFLLAGKR
jgi:hypothetical protein